MKRGRKERKKTRDGKLKREKRGESLKSLIGQLPATEQKGAFSIFLTAVPKHQQLPQQQQKQQRVILQNKVRGCQQSTDGILKVYKG
mmetsp:Transcript_1331/g.3256  ORF Transcript_1331/g.3256 Transcript_1331/m.3256 type:complete len:87 (+) Transcript_1331:179-439(+)